MKEAPNLDYIKLLAAGDRAFEIELYSVIKKEFPGEVIAYKSNLRNGNFLKASENVHKLKNKMGILNMEEAYDFALIYERSLKDGNLSEKNKFHGILDRIENYINSTTI